MVFVHGLGVSSRYMIPTMRLLAAEYAVYGPDLPGYGRSDKPGRVMGIPELADALVGWMDAVGLGRAAMVCNSMGCQVAVDVAVRYPARVDRLVLSGPTIDPAARSPFVLVWRLVRDAFEEDPALFLVAGGDYVRAGPLRVMRTLQLAMGDPVQEKLGQVGAPALVVRGSLDALAPQAWSERVAALLPRGRLVVIRGAPHGVNFSAAGKFAKVIRVFLR